jgi:hypothetical protein
LFQGVRAKMDDEYVVIEKKFYDSDISTTAKAVSNGD